MNIKSYFKVTAEAKQNPLLSWARLPCPTEPVCTQNSRIFMPQHAHKTINNLFNDYHCQA